MSTGRSREAGRRIPGGLLACLCFLLLVPEPAAAVTCMPVRRLFDATAADGLSLRQPSDISLSGDRLFVLDDLNGRAVAYSLRGQHLLTVPLPGGGKSSYLGFDVGGDDNLYLASGEAGKIVVVSQKGKAAGNFETGEKDSESEPVAVVVSRGQCIVADNSEHSVKIFDLDGKLIVQWGELGDGPLAFRHPFRLVQDSLGRIVVADTLNSRIKVFTPKGEALVEFGDFGVTEGTLFRPTGLALWGDDQIIVADNYLGVLQLFDFSGAYQATVCGEDGTPLLFENPVSLASRGTTLFVLEMGAGRVRAIEAGR